MEPPKNTPPIPSRHPAHVQEKMKKRRHVRKMLLCLLPAVALMVLIVFVKLPGPDTWNTNILRSDEIPIDSDGFYAVSECEFSVLGSGYLREEICSVTFLDTLSGAPEDAWDVSEAGDGSVMAWVEPEDGMYRLSIAGEGGVSAGASCRDLFAGYTNVTQISFDGNFHTDAVQDMDAMFYYCFSLTALDLSSFDTSAVQDMSHMFFDCFSLTALNLSAFDTSAVQDMGAMFYDCSSLASLDLSSFDTSAVQDMGAMFFDCGSLTALDLSSFDTSAVQDMSMMFESCSSLTSLDLSSFDTSAVQHMSQMFCNCGSLTVLDLSSFDTSAVQDMSQMFLLCQALTSLDLSSFDTSAVQDTTWMLFHCPAGDDWQHLLKD